MAKTSSRQLLFRDLSDTFFIDQTPVPTTEPSVRSADATNFKSDPDALVARIARTKIREDALRAKVQKMIDQLSDDLPLDAAADTINILQGLDDDDKADKADKSHESETLAALLNSRVVEKSMMATVLRQECDCTIVEKDAEIRRWIVDDMKAAPRGGVSDPANFTSDIRSRMTCR